MRKDGGNAFPYGEATGVEPGFGMTLRDYFAAKAMHAEVMTSGVPGPACDALVAAAHKAGRDPADQLAFNAYEWADAMLKARG